jgi:RHS repeat-associated protein
VQVTTAARAFQRRVAARRARRRNTLRAPHVRAQARRKRAPARAQAQPSTHGPRGVVQRRGSRRDQLHPVAELDGSGALVARFVWVSGKNTPDLVITGGVTYRVFTDQLGSPRMLVNSATGAVGGVMRHDAWGVVLEDTVSGLMPFGFAGGLWDAETGLVRFGARDYDPTVGRWVSKDPLRFDSGDGPNLYLYVNGDPVNFVDSYGRQAIPAPIPVPLGPVLGIGAGAGALACALSPSCRDAIKRLWDDIWGIRKDDIKQIDEICRRNGLDRALRRRLHDEITGQDLDLTEIEEIAKELARKRGPVPNGSGEQ